MLRKILFALSLGLLMVACNNNPQSKEQKYYEKFQQDSLKQCTQNELFVKADLANAFDRIPSNNGFWKRDKMTYEYDPELKLWVGTVYYHYDRNNTYYQSSVTFHVKYWATQGEKGKADVFSKVTRVTN